MGGYAFLRVSRCVFMVAAVLVGIFMLAAGVVILAAGGEPNTPRIMGLGVMLNGILLFFLLFALGAGIKLLLELAWKLGLPSDEEPT